MASASSRSWFLTPGTESRISHFERLVKIECFHETFSLSTHDPKFMLLTLVFKFFGAVLSWESPVTREDMVEAGRLDVVECGFAQPADVPHSLGSLST